MNRQYSKGVTLLELAIVLTIIGLVVGGVLVGQDLVRASAVRATIAQIDGYKRAVSNFQMKYVALPGDIPAYLATQFNFTARGSLPGQGDGNGVLEGNWGGGQTTTNGQIQGVGETGLFWVDLTTANGQNLNFIDGSFSTATATSYPSTTTNIALYVPSAKIGRGNYIYVWSGGPTANGIIGVVSNGINYYGISSITQLINNGTQIDNFVSGPGLTVKEAYDIDAKIDDGLPQSGAVTAAYAAATVGYWGKWAGAASATNGPTTAATQASSTTCYDNGNVAGTQQYSLATNNGNGVNCALSFQF